MKRRPDPPQRTFGSIHADELLPMREFGRRLNLANRALADAQRQGLRTILFGRCKYVLGSDAIAFFQGLAEQQARGGDDG